MKLGIVGLPNVGKSTLFNSLTKAGAESANYPFCTIDPNVGIVTVPDKRLKLLGDLYHSKKVTPAVIEFVDIAGLVKGASKGEGLGNQFLANIREVDAIVHVVRCFEDPNVIHVEGSVDPIRDIETINLELIFSDLEILERRIAKTTKSAFNDKSLAKELEILKELKAILEDGKLASSYENDDEDVMAFVNSLNLLTCKPVIFVANVGEDDLADDGANNAHVSAVREYAKENNSEVFVICARIEEEISEEYDEKRMSFQDILKILEDTTYHMLEAKNVHIQLEFRCSDNFMTEEHYELMAVLKNLVNNAIEAIESDRKIGTICIEEHLRNGNYIFCVTDDGPGISPRHLPNIFKMGYSTKFDHKTGNIFRGVGLYGVKMTVEEQFKGTIEVRSEQGSGTAFTVVIPAASLVEEEL